MTLREYIFNTRFNEIWTNLCRFYQEEPEMKRFYEHFYNSLIALPQSGSGNLIELSTDMLGGIKVEGTLDTPEEIVDCDVRIADEAAYLSVAEIATHLLYWSSIYGYQTSEEKVGAFKEWLDSLDHSGPYFDMEGNMIKHIFVDLTEGYFKKETLLKYRNASIEDIADMLGMVLEAMNVNEVAVKARASYILFIPKEIHTDVEVLTEILNNSGLHIYRIYDCQTQNGKSPWKLIGTYTHDKNTPYIILSASTDSHEDHEPYILRIGYGKNISADEISRSIDILNRFDNIQDREPTPEEVAEKDEEDRLNAMIERSLAKKRQHYWRDTILEDQPWDWTFNYSILRKKLAYNIGYWKFVKHHVGWENDMRRMQTAVRLLDILISGEYEESHPYLNTRNATRYGITIEPSDKFLDFRLDDLYKAKAFAILWRFLDHNMQKWWD